MTKRAERPNSWGGWTQFSPALLLTWFSVCTRITKTNMPLIQRSFYLLNALSIFAIFLCNWTHCRSEVKTWSQDWLIAAGAYPGFCSMKRLEVFLLPLDGMLVHRRSLPRNLLGCPNNLPVPTWVERGTVRVIKSKSPQESNKIKFLWQGLKTQFHSPFAYG